MIGSFQRTNTIVTFDMFKGASEDELIAEVGWAIRRKGSISFGQDAGIIVASGTFSAALNAFELGNLQIYQRTHPGCAYMLNQDAATSHGIKSTKELILLGPPSCYPTRNQSVLNCPRLQKPRVSKLVAALRKPPRSEPANFGRAQPCHQMGSSIRRLICLVGPRIPTPPGLCNEHDGMMVPHWTPFTP